jgi:hypothetical protein
MYVPQEHFLNSVIIIKERRNVNFEADNWVVSYTCNSGSNNASLSLSNPKLKYLYCIYTVEVF